eukprot:TRINITY_DN5731_c0_g2_i1.p1 TRINITY_DN5731_c0_g2~~TRINITY_DN5731_c0_g2_i1.p1  ORF type:complete len:1753 (+),score=537.61 TRINITY_DN5731_c0_g2_i1:137-5395(+)
MESGDADAEFKKHSRYRSFHSDIEKELASFDKVKEWADLVQCLKRIDQVLDKYSQFPIIPAKLTFCKRMAQCLNPSLPSGVHVQTLKTFAKVFDRIGPERLARDIGLFCMGIFPLFQHAATQVKPVILKIYEIHFLPLGSALAPCLSGLIMSLLPGLEEENGEFYDRCRKLLDYISKKTSSQLFFRALWKCVMVSSTIRLPAISYLTQRLPQHKNEMSKESVTAFIPDASTLVRNALRCGLRDAQLLTQRAAMELLITHFRLDEDLFSQEDLIVLASSSLLVVTRREVSLNRRLYAWLLGGANEADAAWFKQYGKPVAVGAVHMLFEEMSNSTTANGVTLPLRVLMALLDKPEIGAEIIEPLLPAVFRCLNGASREGFKYAREVKQTVSQLFDMLDPSIIWSAMAELFVQQLETGDPVEAIVLIGEVIDLLPLGEVQTQSIHLPDMLCGLASGLSSLAEQEKYPLLLSALQLTLRVYGKMAPFNTNAKAFDTTGITAAMAAFEEFFVDFMTNNVLNRQHGESSSDAVKMSDFDLLLPRCVYLSCKVLTNLESHLPEPEGGANSDQEPEWYRLLLAGIEMPYAPISCLCASSYANALKHSPSAGISSAFRQRIVSDGKDVRMVVEKLWSMLHFSLTSIHFRIAKVFLALHDSCKEVITAVIGEALLASDIETRVDGCNRFALLWRLVGDMTTKRVFSDNLLLMLDSLSDKEPVVRLAGRTWLAASISKVERILDPLLLVLLDPSTARFRNRYRTTYDARRVLYVLRILKAVIESDFRVISNAQNKVITRDVLALNQQQVIDDPSAARDHHSPDDMDLRESENGADDGLQVDNYVGLMALTAMRFVVGQVGDQDAAAEFIAQNRVVQTTSAEFLRYMLLRMTDTAQLHAANIARVIQPYVLRELGRAVTCSDLVLQVELLRLLQTVVMLYSGWNHPRPPPAASTSASALSVSPATPSGLGARWESICKSTSFLEILISGLQQPNEANVRHYWLEFITATMPYLHNHLASFVSPLCSSMCDIIVTFENAHDSVSIMNVVIVLRTLHVILSYGLSKEPEREQLMDQQKDESNPALTLITMPLMPVQMLAGFVKDVFVDDSSSVAPPQLTPSAEAREELFKILPLILRAMVKVWSGSSSANASTTDEIHNKYIVQDLITRTLDPIMANYPSELLFSICCLWEQDKHIPESTLQETVLQILQTFDSLRHDVVFGSLRQIVASVLRSRSKIQRGSNGSGDTVASVPIHETSTLDFLNRYLSVHSSSSAESLKSAWPDFLMLVKEQMASRTPATFLLLLRTFDLYVEKAGSILMQDKHKVRELQEGTTKVVELCVKISSDISSTLAAGNRDEESVQRMRALSLKALGLVGGTVPDLYDSVFGDDKERACNAISNILPTLVSFLKDHRPHPAVLAGACASLQFFSGLLRFPHTFKVWRKDISDLFYSSDFFHLDFNAVTEWRSLINHIMTVDKGFSDLKKILSKSLLTHQASMMFVSKEQENRMRARNIKRLSFVLYSGEVDQYQTQLSWIQEKLAEALRLSDAYPVYIEVFHCLRILLLRISPKRLASFWPVIFAELMRFLGFSRAPTHAPLVLSACKFIDVALLVPAEEFKLCEWLFVHDSSSAFSSNLELFVPFIARLCDASPASDSNSLLNVPKGPLRRPLIIERHVETMDTLLPYLSTFSSLAYESTILGSDIDIEFLERVVEADMIEFKHIDKFEHSPVRLLTQEEAQQSDDVTVVAPKRQEPKFTSQAASLDPL